MIQFKNVTSDAFEDASFEVEAGCSCKIITSSGYVKKVLLDTMLGLRKPASGSVFLFGRDIYCVREQEFLEIMSRIGVIWQDGGLISNLKIRENIVLPSCYHQGKRAGDLEGKVSDLLGSLRISGQISEFMGALPGQLQVREKRLAGLMRSILSEPELVICDSLFEELGPEDAEVLTRLMRDFQMEKQGRASIYISPNEQSLLHMETDVIYKQVKRELRLWKS